MNEDVTKSAIESGPNEGTCLREQYVILSPLASRVMLMYILV